MREIDWWNFLEWRWVDRRGAWVGDHGVANLRLKVEFRWSCVKLGGLVPGS